MMDQDALIGYTGFVGATLLRQRSFGSLFRSNNVQDVDGRAFGTVVCAAAPAQKWIANQNPSTDKANIGTLMHHLDRLQCESFILVSTVDVFQVPVEVDEDSDVLEDNLQAYGLHRRILERFVAGRFSNHLIVRLPGLVGPGLRKNVIYDFHHDNNLEAIDSRGVFQFYPMVNLWSDLRVALTARLRVVHLTAEPISVAEVAQEGFGRTFSREKEAIFGHYDIRTKYAEVFGATGSYQYSRKETILAIRAYAQSEPS